ncbi:MAG: TetR/AcrR family transcriptional regulator [Planctomycetes bacterium]|nr:TetR/AcrR family transcriptional regulator [Planctomycetota bacterium]
MSRKTRRNPYDSSRRREQARERQERMLEAARRSFAEKGYRETTIGEIAKQAGVSVPTVYAAFGSKRGILSRLLGRLVSGEPGGPPVLQTSRAQEVMRNPDRRRALQDFARHMREILARVAPVHFMIRSAARSEPELAELLSEMQRNRFNNMRALARSLAATGPLHDSMKLDDAARTIWVLASAEVRQLLIEQAGWSEARYEKWLAGTLTSSLLPR